MPSWFVYEKAVEDGVHVHPLPRPSSAWGHVSHASEVAWWTLNVRRAVNRNAKEIDVYFFSPVFTPPWLKKRQFARV